jgi:transcriptional regulator GlxA family with amidase domain
MISLGAVLFPNFELLDFAGPMEMFGSLKDVLDVTTVAQDAGPVRSTQRVDVVAAHSFDTAPEFDLVLLPGGWGTFDERDNEQLLDYLRRASERAEIVMTVCSGSALLSRSGVLDGRRATTNKAFWKQCVAEGPKVNWVPEARWVDDGKFVTSSGVSAGMDMALAVVQRKFGADAASRLATMTEYEWHRDPAWDPFAKLHGLVPETEG